MAGRRKGFRPGPCDITLGLRQRVSALLMTREKRDNTLERSLRAFQVTVTRAGPAAMAGYTMIGAILVLGAAGYGLDAWLGSRPWGLVGGLALGIVLGFYELVKTTWRR